MNRTVLSKAAVTPDGEIAENSIYNKEQIAGKALYDGFYAVITNLEGDVSEIIKLNKQR